MKPPAAVWAGMLSAVLIAALLAWNDASPATAAEPWPARWARTAAEHPLRTGLALALLAWALCPGRPVPREPNAR